jgi:hypothetical protein
MKRIARLAAIAATFLLFLSCSDPRSRWRAGGLYSVWEGQGSFGVVKILAVDPEAVSIRWYKESFPDRPATASSTELSLGSVDDQIVGIGHLPLAHRDFAMLFPLHIAQETVSEEELEDYRTWSESGVGPVNPVEFGENAEEVEAFLEAIEASEYDGETVADESGGESGDE